MPDPPGTIGVGAGFAAIDGTFEGGRRCAVRFGPAFGFVDARGACTVTGGSVPDCA
jgi:hypothetical protein